MKEFLERRSQGHFSPSTGRRRYFLAFQPLCVNEGLGRAVDLAWFHLGCILIE
jgi:hypothetical protein